MTEVRDSVDVDRDREGSPYETPRIEEIGRLMDLTAQQISIVAL